METFKRTKIFHPTMELTTDLQKKINHHFKSLKEVGVEVTPDYVKLEYYPQLYSEDFFKEELKHFGVILRRTRQKGLFKPFLDKLAKDNKEAFGDRGPDCCSDKN